MAAEKHVVTGVSGFLGQKLASRLVEAGYEVVGLDLRRPYTEIPGVEFHHTDIRDENQLQRIFRGVDVVHHMAALVPLAKQSKEFWSVNVEGSRIVARTAKRLGVSKFVYTSSSAVYGKTGDTAITEETPKVPMERYGKSKLEGEFASASEFYDADSQFLIVRPRTVLGDGRGGIFSLFFDWVKRGLPIYTIGDGSNRFQFIHVDDLINGYLAGLYSGRSGEFNIGSPAFSSLRESFEQLVRHAGTGSRVVQLPKRPTIFALTIAEKTRLSPLQPYHRKAFHRSFFFDVSPLVELGWSAKFSSTGALIASYDHFVAETALSGVIGDSPNSARLRGGFLETLQKLVASSMGKG